MKKSILMLLTIVLTVGLCSAPVFAYSVNTDSNVDFPDGTYTFTGDGDIYDYESYLQYENNPDLVASRPADFAEAPYWAALQLWGGDNGAIGRNYEVTLPDNGKIKIDVASDDITHMNIDVFDKSGQIYEWTAVTNGSSLSFSKTTEALQKGTYTVRFCYPFNNVKISDRVTRPDFYDGPGKRYFYHGITYIKAPYPIAGASLSGIKNKVYTGKTLTQAPAVKLGGKTLKKGTDYTLTYKNNKAVGKATVTINGKGSYIGTITKTFTIVPKATSLIKVTAAKKAFTVKWKKQAADTTGYQIQYSTNKSFKSGTQILIVAKNKKVSAQIKKLKARKKYYVRIRTYKKVGNTNYCSAWSKIKTVMTK